MNAVEMAMRLRKATAWEVYVAIANEDSEASGRVTCIAYDLDMGCPCPECYPDRWDKTKTWDDIIYAAQQEQL